MKMPRKIRQLLQEYMKNGATVSKSGGKGSHRKVTHGKLGRTIIVSGQDGEDAKHYQEYHKITWSKEDGCFIGTCPELFDGGCHGNTRAEVAEQLENIIEDVITDYKAQGKRIPAPTKRSARFTYALNARRRTGLNQKQFAAVIGVGLGTLRNWEQGRVMPRGAAKTLLEVIEDRPDVIRAREKLVSK